MLSPVISVFASRSWIVPACVATGLLTFPAPSVHAQQFVVDDAGITDPGACQFEGWLSEAAGWILPACTPMRRTELTLGIGYVDDLQGDHSDREVQYVAQAKVSLLPEGPGTVGVAVVAGLGLGPFAQAAGIPLEAFFAYVPLTYTLLNGRAVFHLNGGWAYGHEDDHHQALYGIRADAVLHERVIVVGELFGEGSERGVQGGLRVTVIPDLVVVDASYGAEVAGDRPDIGVALGVAVTPRPFFAPVR
jgi:hypothetical protein